MKAYSHHLNFKEPIWILEQTVFMQFWYSQSKSIIISKQATYSSKFYDAAQVGVYWIFEPSIWEFIQ